MELVYLWVEEYKNIKEQGFNFSPRFKCNYNPDTKELTIDENDDYVSIFPENINITVIVGENGSGKSNLLEILFSGNLFVIKHFCMLIKKDTKYILYSVSIETNESTKKFKEYTIDSNVKHYSFNLGELETLSDNIKDFSTIFYSTSTLVKAIRENSYIKNTHNLALFENQYYHNYKIQQTQNVIAMIKNNVIFEQLFELPKMFTISSKTKDKNIYENIMLHINNKSDLIDKTTRDKFLLACKKLSSKHRESEKHLQFWGSNINDLHENFINYYQKIVEQTKSDFLFFEFHPNLSTGQETYLYQFASFYNALKKEINNDIVFCIDEGESTMHPNWQRQYIKYLTDFLSSNFTDKNIQIILTSHSPFLLSDLQKENVIFLEKYKKDEDKNQKEGNCKVLKDGIKKQTFGANIHTLLSDGFFMSDGLMGEFAKQTINKIIEDLKNDNYKPQKEEKERVFKIIQTIGEPFLKQKLLDMYYKKFDKEARKKELEKEKARIEEELKKYD